jgi:hypothetical protein
LHAAAVGYDVGRGIDLAEPRAASEHARLKGRKTFPHPTHERFILDRTVTARETMMANCKRPRDFAP